VSHAMRGRILETAIRRAATAYNLAGRCALVKRATPMRKVDGAYRYAERAGCDFDGMLDGGRRIVLEAKMTEGKSLPLDKLPQHQQDELAMVARMGGAGLVVCAFEALGETYAIAWPELHRAFFARIWRESIPLDVFRGWGRLVPDAPRHDPKSRSCLFLDGAPHVEAAAARARIEREASTRVRKGVEELDLSPGTRTTAGPVARTPEERRARTLEAISDFQRTNRKRYPMARSKKSPAPKKQRPKQTQIPGTEQTAHVDVEDAAERYLEVHETRRELAAEAKELKQNLIELMKKHGVTSYRFEDHIVEAGTRDVVRFKKQKPPQTNTPDDLD